MLRRSAVAASAATLLATTFGAGGAAAFTCNDLPAVDLGVLYVDVRHLLQDEGTADIFIFAENGLATGLQRGADWVGFALSGQHELAQEYWYDYHCPYNPAGDYMVF